MNEPFGGGVAMQFPRPGKALRALMWVVAGVAVLGALAFQWTGAGRDAFAALVFVPGLFLHGEFWRIFTAGFLSPPGAGGVSHLLFTLIGLYFLCPDLERRWGSARFVAFVFASLVGGFLLGLAGTALPFGGEALHPPVMYGMGAVIVGAAAAWARMNADLQIRLMFVLPVKGSQFLWITLGYCVLGLIFGDGSTEGVLAPFGGVGVGLLFAGASGPSSLRTAYLKWKLGSLQKRSGFSGASLLESAPPRRRAGAPPLRVVQGGADDDPPKREPPRDKRYLN